MIQSKSEPNSSGVSNIEHKPQVRRVLLSEGIQTMDADGWEDVREEVCTHLEIGMSRGETELDTMTRLIWLERQDKFDAIEKAVTAALNLERGLAIRKARVLQWRPPSRSSGRPR